MGSSVYYAHLVAQVAGCNFHPKILGSPALMTERHDLSEKRIHSTLPTNALKPGNTLQAQYSVALKSRLKRKTSGRTPSWGAFGLSAGCQGPTTSSFYARGLMINTHLHSSQRSLGATEDQSLLSAFRAIHGSVLSSSMQGSMQSILSFRHSA